LKVLLDTHVFLWWVSERGARLSDRARDLLSDGGTKALLSMASAWELAIKAGSGRIELPDEIGRYVPDRLRRHGFELLPIELTHAIRAGTLPRHHGDPFDRMLVAQGQVEGVAIVTADPAIGRYDVETIW
jgi:PIN domain nuclease of toxin-antitoxin system